MSSPDTAEFHCWFASTPEEATQKGDYLYGFYGRFLDSDRPIVELGCGEGAFLSYLKNRGFRNLLGVDSNPELLALARSFGVPVRQADLADYLAESTLEPAIYLYLDVIEHVPFEFNLTLLRGLPPGSRIIIQTPYTRSLRGHECYFNVPSHLAAYSPWVLHRLLERNGYKIVAEGSVDGAHADNWKRRVRAYFIRKFLALDPEMLLGGGNYFVVGDRLQANS